jgi:hypothetical protein
MVQRKYFALLAGVVLFIGFDARSHDLRGLLGERKGLDPAVSQKIDDRRELRRILAAKVAETRDQQQEAVVRERLKWDKSPVTVCFFDGQQAARDHVASIASRWTKGNSLRFDFGPQRDRRTCDINNPSDIRISFYGDGYSSWVGTEARDIPAGNHTMSLEGLDKNSGFSSRENGVIVHEFGHAIGFDHEHQSPHSKCEEEFDWPYLYNNMGWKKEEIDANMKRLGEESKADGLFATAFDDTSVMLYALAPAYFLKGEKARCYISRKNHLPSKMDLEIARRLYP